MKYLTRLNKQYPKIEHSEETELKLQAYDFYLSEYEDYFILRDDCIAYLRPKVKKGYLPKFPEYDE